MSGRTSATQPYGRGNGAAGLGSGNFTNYGTNAVPNTSSRTSTFQAVENAYYYRQTGYSYPLQPSIPGLPGAQYYDSKPAMLGLWQQRPPDSTHGNATFTTSRTSHAITSSGIPVLPGAQDYDSNTEMLGMSQEGPLSLTHGDATFASSRTSHAITTSLSVSQPHPHVPDLPGLPEAEDYIHHS